MTLKELEIGKSAVIKVVGGEGALRQHFLDMGVIPGAEVTVIKFAPMGDPMELQIHGYELTLRLSDAEQIEIELISERSRRHEGAKNINQSVHPGLGEEGKYHVKGDGRPLPEQEKLTYALVGNQNCGKTTLFNQLTGSNQHIGNFPGVTVDRKDGAIKGHPNTSVTDLPGIYSMSPYSSEEIVSRNFVLEDKPKAMINIIDATNIERNLYLTMQLLEMDIPMVIALNMMDEMTGTLVLWMSMAWRQCLVCRLSRSQRQKMKVWMSWYVMRFTLQNIRNVREGRIFVMRVTLEEPCTAVSMQFRI